jgi:hypothetical protein
MSGPSDEMPVIADCVKAVARRTTLPDDIRRATPDHGLPPEWRNAPKRNFVAKNQRARAKPDLVPLIINQGLDDRRS